MDKYLLGERSLSEPVINSKFNFLNVNRTITLNSSKNSKLSEIHCFCFRYKFFINRFWLERYPNDFN